MNLIHHLGILSINKNVNENIGFLLTGKNGSYCSFFNQPSSRYQGLFYFDKKTLNMYRFIENIEIPGNNKIDFIKNGFYFAERKKGNAIELFFMPKGFNSLIYELNSENEIELALDCKNSYDNREFGRHYEIFEEDGFIIVKFTKKSDKREDKKVVEEFVLYLAIKTDNNLYEKIDKWTERHYFDDENRRSPPFRRFVYNALKLKGTKFVFSISKSKKSAIKESEFVFSNLIYLKQKEKEHFFNMLKNENIKKAISNEKISKEIKVAYISTANSLGNLVVEEKDYSGIFAGLPWFFQFWTRDALISLKALSKINKNFAEKILLNYLEMVKEDGRLPNIWKPISNELVSADAAGWMFLRCNNLVDKINKDKETINSIKKSMYWIKQSKLANAKNIREHIKRCNSMISRKENEYYKLLYYIENSFEKSINGLLKFHTSDSFEFNGPKETWMDTEFGGDNRNGARIELQALRLNMYKLGFELTQNHKFKVLENTLKIKTKNKFWNGEVIADGLNDFTIRPNIFIAAYVYPEFLSNKEWEICFDNTLKSLWLEWGGLSTIDKDNNLFTDIDTGENVKSYHRGNSWFWLNNLAALVLNKINKNKFQKNIQKIISASTEDILWKGCIGCASELSHARELSSRGCFSQAWSNAMYVELIEEIYKD